MTDERRYFLFALVFSVAFGCSHATPNSEEQDCHIPPSPGVSPTPVLVLMELNPWLMVIDSDVPSFVLYADGDVLYSVRHKDGEPTGALRQGRMSRADLDYFLASLPLEALASLDKTYLSWNATDLTTTVIVWWADSVRHQVSVYGPVLRVAETSERRTIKASPAPFVDVYERLLAFQLAANEPFAPQVVEAMFTPFEYSKGPSLPWPETWPGFDSPGAKKPTATHAGKIFLRGACWSALVQDQKLLGQKGAVVLDGHKFALNARYVLPNEKAWVFGLPTAH